MKLERSGHKDHTPQGTPSLQSNTSCCGLLQCVWNWESCQGRKESWRRICEDDKAQLKQQHWRWVIVSSSNTTAQTIQSSLWRPKQILTSWGQSFLPLSVNTTELTGMRCLWIHSSILSKWPSTVCGLITRLDLIWMKSSFMRLLVSAHYFVVLQKLLLNQIII